MPLPVANEYYYQQALRRLGRTPGEARALPSAQDLTLAYVSADTMEDERAREAAEDIRLGKARLTEAGRQRGENLALERYTLGELEKQDETATMISLANLGVQAISGYAGLKWVAEREKRDKELMAMHKDILKMKKKGLKFWDDLAPLFKKTAAGSGTSWHQLLTGGESGGNTRI